MVSAIAVSGPPVVIWDWISVNRDVYESWDIALRRCSLMAVADWTRSDKAVQAMMRIAKVIRVFMCKKVQSFLFSCIKIIETGGFGFICLRFLTVFNRFKIGE